MEKIQILGDVEIMPLYTVESGAPAERPRENARLGVTRRNLPGRALAEERTVGGDVPFLPEDLADINAEAGDRGTDVEAGKEFPA